MRNQDMLDLLALLDSSLQVEKGKVVISDTARLQQTIHRLAEISALEANERQGWARYLTRQAALAFGAVPASIYDLYMARGRGEIPFTFTVPAINLRALSFDAARAVFRAAKAIDAGAFIFEIARSEMGYTDQRPAEYATNVLAAAIAEDYHGPVFIQGDHFQVSASRYADDPDSEVDAVRQLTKEAIASGFFNIDIDTSTLVDLSQKTIPEQQKLNTNLSALYTAEIRSEEPEDVTISVGGEIGEVGGRNSTEAELRAYMNGYLAELHELDPQAKGISKISIQTGTSHGGIVLPDGSIKQVSVDFDTLRHLSQVARQDFGLAGAVQHGASTLPEGAFGKFAESEACEVHLATNFQNILFDHLPENLRIEMYAYLDDKHAGERKSEMTDEQFYYKTRKRAIGPFKSELWNMSQEKRHEISQAWENQFNMLFHHLGIRGTRKYIDQTIHPVVIRPQQKFYLGEASGQEEVADLAD